MEGVMQMSSLTDWVNDTPSMELQVLQYSLRHGYEDAGNMKEKYKQDISLEKETKKFDTNRKLMNKIFNRINRELRKRAKKEKLEKCYSDRCHDKCSDNCTCGWCLTNKGFEPLI